MDLEIETTAVGEYRTVLIEGELDIYSAPQLKLHLSSLIIEGESNILLDLTRVTFLDSTGLGVIVGTYKRLHSVGGQLRIICTLEPILEIFEITGLGRIIPIFPTLEAAKE